MLVLASRDGAALPMGGGGRGVRERRPVALPAGQMKLHRCRRVRNHAFGLRRCRNGMASVGGYDSGNAVVYFLRLSTMLELTARTPAIGNRCALRNCS